MTISCTDADRLPRVSDAGSLAVYEGRPVQVMHNGILVEKDCYYGAWMTEIIRCLRGVHEPQEERAFAVVLDHLRSSPPSDRRATLVELGSFWAYYSLWFLREFPEGRTICLEPDPANLEVGRRNFTLNRCTGEFVHAFVGDGDGGPAAFTPESGGPPIDLPAHSLGSLLREVGVQAVDVLLADIQGAEVALLGNAERLLRTGAVRFVVISTHDLSISGSATTHQDVLRILRDCGAHVIAEHSVSESFSGDGLVVASFDERDRDLSVEVSFARSRDSLFGEWEVRCEALRSEVERLRQALDAKSVRGRFRRSPQGSKRRRLRRR